MANRIDLDAYVDVAERIEIFHEAYPTGSLQTVSWHPVTIGDRVFIVYRAAAFRTPDDERPGHGTAWEPFPGPTQFTKDSELMNAETSAWGRAIVACGMTASRKIASRQEVRNRQAAQDAPQAAGGAQEGAGGPTRDAVALLPVTDGTMAELRKQHAKVAPSDDEFRALIATAMGVAAVEGPIPGLVGELTEDQATALVLALMGKGS